LAGLSPGERAAVVARGWWRDGESIVFVDGERVPVDELAARLALAKELALLTGDRVRRLTEAVSACTGI
jgi:hypothetical protein